MLRILGLGAPLLFLCLLACSSGCGTQSRQDHIPDKIVEPPADGPITPGQGKAKPAPPSASQ
jgi:hypothetical protein